MAIKYTVVCDSCKKHIREQGGYAVLGNIHVIGTEDEDFIGGGVVGNNLDERGDVDVVTRTSHYCTKCFVTVVFGENAAIHFSPGSFSELLKSSIETSYSSDSLSEYKHKYDPY